MEYLTQISRTVNLGSYTPLKISFKNIAKYGSFIIKCWKNSFSVDLYSSK